MTFAKTTSSVSLPEQGDILLRVLRQTIQWHTTSLQNVHIRRRVSNRMGLTTPQNVPQPRDCVNEPFSRYGVGSRARVDPFREDGAHTAGPTCTPQRGRVRKAPPPPVSRYSEHTERPRRSAGGGGPDVGELPTYPALARPVMGPRLALRTCVLASVEIDPHPCPITLFDLAGVGCTMPQRSIEMRRIPGMPKEVKLDLEPEKTYGRLAIDEIRAGNYHVARGWLLEALDARQATRTRYVPVLRTRPEDKTSLDRPITVTREELGPDAPNLLGNRGPWRP